MSRNFELLNQAGKLQDVLNASIEMPAEVEPVVEEAEELAPEGPAVLPLEIEGTARDEINKLVQRLFLVPGSRNPRRVVFTGSESGVGCSWVCAHAAESLASQIASSVCIVDCNLRTPALHTMFGLENHFGLSDALVGQNPIRKYARRLSRKNLWLLSCGSTADNWQTLLTSDRMRSRISELTAQFDYVMLDVAPLNGSNDGIAIGALCDGVVLVLKANSSRREIARKALQEMKIANVQTLGAVLNQRTFPIPDSIYKIL